MDAASPVDHMTLFEAAGFALRNDVPTFPLVGRSEEEGVKALDASTFGPPSSTTRRFCAVYPKETSEPAHLDACLFTGDAQDVVAFAIACDSQIRFGVHGDQLPDDRLIDWHDMALHNPFADEQYGDWHGTRSHQPPGSKNTPVLLIDHPSNHQWEGEYRKWRDRLCKDLLAGNTAVLMTDVPSPSI